MSLFDPQPETSAPAASRSVMARLKQPPKREPMPSWLTRKLESEGHLDFTRQGPAASRRAHAIICPGCKRFIVRGLLAMPTPWSIDVDPEPLSCEGEALAILAGLDMDLYRLKWLYDHYEIDRRDHSRIGFKPVTYNQGFDVVIAHRCGERPDLGRQPSQLPDPRDAKHIAPEEPPF